MGLAEDICYIGHRRRWLNTKGESIGILLRGITKEDIQRGDYILCNADWRIKKALELCGFEVANRTMIVGIERFCWC